MIHESLVPFARSGVSAASEQNLLPPRKRYLVYGLQLSALLVPLVLLGYFGGRHLWAWHHFRGAQEALKHRDFTQAQIHLRDCLWIWNRDLETHLLAARTARWAGQFEEAESLLNDCERFQGSSQEVLLERLLLKAQRGELDSGMETQLWTLIDQGHPTAAQILETLSQVYLYQYRLDRAVRSLEAWLRLQPDVIQALIWRAQVRQAHQQFDDAVKDFQRAVDLDPDADDARLQLANLLVYLERADRALEHLEHLRRRQPTNPTVRFRLARCRYRLGQTAAAQELLDTLLAESPKHLDALRERGRIALDEGREAEAEPWLRQCLALVPDHRETLYLLGQCLQRLGRETESREYLAKQKQLDGELLRLQDLARLITASPQDVALRQEAGAICLRHGRDEEAVRWLTGSLQIDPSYRPAHQSLAEYYELSGRPDLAAQHRQ